MTDKPTVSVVIPCYNAAPFLRETLDSAINQTYPPFEILVIDDGSTDDSAAIAEFYGPPVRVIRQPNQGESVARNRGIDEAKGEWIAFLDADDVWQSNRIEAQLKVCMSDTIAGHCNLEFFGVENFLTQIERIPASIRYSPVELCRANHFISPSAVLVKRNICPRFPAEIRHAEDLVFFLELVQRGPVSFVAEPLVRYRRHSSAQSVRVSTRIGWYRTIDGWLSANSSIVAEQEADGIRQEIVSQLVSLAWSLKERRRWDDYWLLREFLTSFRGHNDVAVLLQNRIYPRFTYWLKDVCRPRRVAS